MKITSEQKLFALMGAIVAIGGGYLVLSSKSASEPGAPGQATPEAPPTPKPLQISEFDSLLAKCRWVKGSPTADYAIIEFADFQCPSCRRAYDNILNKIAPTASVQLGFRHFPLETIHVWAGPAALAAEAAGKQGKFWEMYDALFAGADAELDDEFVRNAAKKAGLDIPRWEKDQTLESVKNAPNADHQTGKDMGVVETPTFFVLNRKTKTVTVAVGGAKLQAALAGVPGVATPAPSPAQSK